VGKISFTSFSKVELELDQFSTKLKLPQQYHVDIMNATQIGQDKWEVGVAIHRCP
jgi:hypothetical protein